MSGLISWTPHRGGGAGGVDAKGRMWLVQRSRGLWAAYYWVEGGARHEVTACRSLSAERTREKVIEVLRREADRVGA